MKVELNKVFEVRKRNKILRWKAIKHPYFDDGLALIRDYCGLYGPMQNGVCKEDYNHIYGTSATLETAYKDAFLMS